MDTTPENMNTLSATAAEKTDQASEIAKAACGLLTASGKLLELALKTADAVSSLEPHVTESIALAVERIGSEPLQEPLDAASCEELAAIGSVARFTAREAASATLSIRAIIGTSEQTSGLHPWSKQPEGVTMTLIEDLLQKLNEHAPRLLDAQGRNKEALNAFGHGISAMLDASRRNIRTASAAASLTEAIHVQAINLVRKMERSGILLK